MVRLPVNMGSKGQGLTLRTWLGGSSPDSDASTAAVLGVIYLLLINFVDIFGYVNQRLPLVVANSMRALNIMLSLLALLPAGRYLGPCLGHTRRWMFLVPAVLAIFESARSIGSIYRTHVVASAIIACIALTFAIDFPDRKRGWMTARRARWFCIAGILSVLLAHAVLKPKPFDVGYTSALSHSQDTQAR